jgi:hypothetical protein
VKRETARPSRIEVKLPMDIAQQIETALNSYRRSDALDSNRARIQREPVERDELRRL